MTDEKARAKQKILGELESIRTLLDDEEELELVDQEPPLLTTPVDAEDATPEGAAQPGAGADDDFPEDEIPILQAAVTDSDEAEEEADDLVARALKHSRATHAHDQAPVPADPETRHGSEEEQPGLFDGEAVDLESSASDAVGQREAVVSPAAAEQSENPFLPRHIRERLAANRLLREQGKSAAAASPPAAEGKSDEAALVDELVRRYLPRIEAELREKIRASLRAAREAEESPSE